MEAVGGPDLPRHKSGKCPNGIDRMGAPRPLSCLAQLLFTDVSSLIGHAAREKKLTLSDLWETPESAQDLYEEFERRWALEKAKPKHRIRIRRVFWSMNSSIFFRAILLQLVAAIGQFCGPLLLNRILRVIELRQADACTETNVSEGEEYMCEVWTGYVLCGALFAALAVALLCQNLGGFLMKRVALRIRGTLMSAVYIKSLKLTNAGLDSVGSGMITNLISNDAEQLLMSIFIMSLVFIAPLQLIACFVMLGFYIGATFLAGMLAVILILLLAVLTMKKSLKYKVMQSQCADNRIKLTNEMITGVRIVKAYGWEAPFEKEVTRLRRDETWQLKVQMYYRCFIVVVIIGAPLLLATTTFSTYTATGGSLSASKVFTCFAIMNLMRFPLAFLPFAMIEMVKVLVSFNRVQSMMLAAERADIASARNIEGDNVLKLTNAEFGYAYIDEKSKGKGKTKGKGKGKGCLGRCCGRSSGGKGKGEAKDEADDNSGGEETSIENQSRVDGATLVEIKQENGEVVKMRRTLTVDNLELTEGGLTFVVGPVGSGKSTLLAALVGEVESLKGSFAHFQGDAGYAAQEPWIINSTLKENVTFGVEEFNDVWYRKVLDACCLHDDIDLFPAGDQTEIGERGINLSGGQRARVGLARAVFRDCKLYLFDDPLAAVDAHVGKALFQQVLGPDGLLKGKTRILVTHQVQYAHLADQVVVVEDGRVTASGSYKELVSKGITLDGLGAENRANKTDGDESAPDKVKVDEVKHRSTDGQKKNGELVQEEKSCEGAVSLATYVRFVRQAFTSSACALTIFTMILNVGARLASDFWLAMWSEDDLIFDLTLQNIIIVYCSIAIVQCACTYARAIVIMAVGAIRASRRLYFLLYRSVFRAKISFFDTTPTGRLLNRFTADMDIVDNNLPGILGQTTGTLELIFSSLIAIIIADKFVVLMILPCVVVYLLLIGKYRFFARDIQRLESVTKSPIFVRVSETLSGITTVRASGYQSLLKSMTFADININQACALLRERSQVWLSVRLEMLSVLISACSALLPILQVDTARSSFVGVAMIHSLELSRFVQSITQMLATVEQKFTSVERIFEYCGIDSEAPVVQPADASLPSSWPLKGAIEFSSVVMRYRPGLDPALRGLSFAIGAGEKLGIVGRTGSGKSSIVVALLRLVEGESGTICLDGHDISKLGLQVLRTSLSMIPQDPVLFGNTTLRLNLDPFNQHADSMLMDALNKVQMQKDDLLTDGLDTKVGEGGSGFSVGQRQLLCLTRAVLRSSKVILLDEATASVDGETDALIQQTIRVNFAESTVLCIAHRIQTILDSDKVLVMNQGKCHEIGTPKQLLSTPNSELRALAVEAGIDCSGGIDAHGVSEDKTKPSGVNI